MSMHLSFMNTNAMQWIRPPLSWYILILVWVLHVIN